MTSNDPNRDISIVATEVLRELDEWTTVTESGRFQIRTGHKGELYQLIHKLLHVCYEEYIKTNSCDLRDILRLIVSDALGDSFEQWLFLKDNMISKDADYVISIARLEDSGTVDAARTLRKALEMLGAKNADSANKKPAEKEPEIPPTKWRRIWTWVKGMPREIYGITIERITKAWLDKYG